MGLGNPGDRYTGTRHNVGFDVVDALASRAAARVDRLDCRALTARARIAGRPLLLAKPQTYMNLSGESVKGLIAKYDVPLADLVVISDDAALPLGRLRLRASGSSGGQKGLQSLIDCLGTNAFPRLRLGIAGERAPAATGGDLSDYVLGRFSKAERPLYEEARANAVLAIETFFRDGIGTAMNQFNQAGEASSTGRSDAPTRSEAPI